MPLSGNRADSPASDPQALFAWALGQLIYDVADDASGVLSALRGHSLARTMYGFNDQVLNAQPFNGTGRLHFTHAPDAGTFAGADDHRLVNYQAFDEERLRDPERYGTREGALAARAAFTGGANAPYTYPDLNNLFLAALRSDGTVITPSFHRDWVFGPLDATNPNWSTPHGKYLLLRPRPAEMGPGFPLPSPAGSEGEFGDVKNHPGSTGGNDSIWIDLGFPVQAAADGRRFKPLFAFLVADLDNRVETHREGERAPIARRSLEGWSRRDVAIWPWLWDRARESLYAVPVGDGDAAPRGPAVPFASFRRRAMPLPAFSDLRTPGRPAGDPEADWRGFRSLSLVAAGLDRTGPPADHGLTRLSALERIELNQTLPAYPREVPFVTPEQREFARAAQAGRQRLAEELYRQLLLVTGASPVPETAVQDPPDDVLSPRRWLAQLAANIVDYVDEDDISTPFNFYSPILDGLAPSAVGRGAETPAGETVPRYWVFGTELPSVVLNEVMVEVGTADPSGAAPVKVWAELNRPAFDVPAPDPLRPSHGGPVSLFAAGGDSNGYSPYRIVVATAPAGTPPFDRPDNVLGSPDRVAGVALFGPTLGTVGNPDQAVPATIGGDRFVIVGPRSEGGQDANRTIVPTRDRPRSTRWHRSSGMEFLASAPPASITVLLRRLANPHFPPDPRPAAGGDANPRYNPYVTVDYMESVPAPASAATRSLGKLQPYASHPNRVLAQDAEQGGGTQHTLGEANRPREAVFDRLVHLDRGLIGASELFSVAGVRPHLLTQRFVTTPMGERADFAHRAPWLDEDLSSEAPRASHRLYRLFEYLGTARRSPERERTNVNSIHDLDAFRAFIGPRLEERFGREVVDGIWERLLRLRSPGMAGADPQVTEEDRPFLSPAIGILPASDPQARGRGKGVEDTIFRAWDPGAFGARRLFDVPGEEHPYLAKELLAALHGRMAERSNVFAVWLTVGYFEVVDDTSQPVRLGAELGGYAQTRIRHRFFAVVDRTNLQLFGLNRVDSGRRVTRALTWSHDRDGAVPGPGAHWVPLAALSGSTATEVRDAAGAPTGRTLPWLVVPGRHLFVDTGRNRELVLVTDVDPARSAIHAVFRRPHDAGFEVSMPGNPGPQRDFDPGAARFQDVVLSAVRLE